MSDNITLKQVLDAVNSGTSITTLGVTVALGGICIGLIIQGMSLYTEERKRKRLAQALILLASIIFVPFSAWAICNEADWLSRIVMILLSVVVVISSVVSIVKVRRTTFTDHASDQGVMRVRAAAATGDEDSQQSAADGSDLPLKTVMIGAVVTCAAAIILARLFGRRR